MDLEFGKYKIDFSREGNNLLLGSSLGHLALMDYKKKRILCEFHVREEIKDICILNNENLFCAGQKEYVYIYDKQGVEIHRLK